MPNVLANSRISSAANFETDLDARLVLTLPNEVTEDEFGTTIKVKIPGVDPSAVDVDCKSNVLTVSCECGEFVHLVDPTTDTTKIKAGIQWGILTLIIPPPPAPVAHRIKINIHDAVKIAPSKAPAKFTEDAKG